MAVFCEENDTPKLFYYELYLQVNLPRFVTYSTHKEYYPECIKQFEKQHR